MPGRNVDARVVADFGHDWQAYDQSGVPEDELRRHPPLARAARLPERLGRDVEHWPLSFYWCAVGVRPLAGATDVS